MLGEEPPRGWSTFENGCPRLADSKTGRKTLPLNTALEDLDSIGRRNDNPYVIVGAKPGRHLTVLQLPWARIRKRAGLDDLRLHEMRHSFASFGAEAGLSLPTLGRLLGHSQTVTTERYAHLADDPVRNATELIGAKIEAVMSG